MAAATAALPTVTLLGAAATGNIPAAPSVMAASGAGWEPAALNTASAAPAAAIWGGGGGGGGGRGGCGGGARGGGGRQGGGGGGGHGGGGHGLIMFRRNPFGLRVDFYILCFWMVAETQY